MKCKTSLTSFIFLGNSHLGDVIKSAILLVWMKDMMGVTDADDSDMSTVAPDGNAEQSDSHDDTA